MTDNYLEGGGGRTSAVTLRDEEMGNNSNNRRRRRSDYDDYSEDCYDEDDQDEDDDDQNGSCCQCMRCPAQLFSSVLLGLLACVLVIGGVFLAFHKWDHTWLLVSAVGVILMAIGTAMHCCSSQNPPKSGSTHRCKVGCSGAVSGGIRGHHHPNHHKANEIVSNGNVLTEQLLPLSNARSVSQLSLNMVPGYFPPLVYSTNGTSYGLEQHSAVVQNISRLVQHQTQLHLQHPGVATQAGVDGAKSFILVPLPSQGANAASIQNIVAAVCQLENTNAASDRGRDAQTTDASSQATQSSFLLVENNNSNTATMVHQQPLAPSTSFFQPSLKHVEVQTCRNDWNIPNPSLSELKPATAAPNSVSADTLSNRADSSSPPTAELSCQTLGTEISSSLHSLEANDSVVDDAPAAETSRECSLTENPLVQVTPTVPSAEVSCDSDNCDTPPVNDSIPNSVGEEFMPVTADITAEEVVVPALEVATVDSEEALSERIDSLYAVPNSNETVQFTTFCQSPLSLETGNVDDPPESDNVDEPQVSVSDSSERVGETTVAPSFTIVQSDTLLELTEETISVSSEPTPSSNSSAIDESEFLDRSSPPPSYEDVAHETSASGVTFGAAYGTM